MDIVEFEPVMAADVARCYNELIEGLPYCCPVLPARFLDARHLACPLCREESLLVARVAGGDVAGFVHTGIAAAPGDEERCDQDEPGIIRFLSYRPGQRRVGEALLEAAENWVRERRRPRVMAWSNDYLYPFYHSPFAHMSDRLGHLHPLFYLAGYRMLFSELIFEWPDFDPPRTTRPELVFDQRSERRDDVTMGGRTLKPVLKLRALQDSVELGSCEMTGWREGYAWREAADWCFCASLMVKDEVRGRGLGKFLLATGLAEMRKAGFRHAGVSTDWDNYRAQLFYTNLGYRLRDRTFAFEKDLSGVETAKGRSRRWQRDM
jgi:GNAT superfamily N-acetyltransferase